MQISVRELKGNLSKYLQLSQTGEPIVIASHNKPVARLTPLPSQGGSGVKNLPASGLVEWDGRKPIFKSQRPKIIGKTAAEYVLEGRE